MNVNRALALGVLALINTLVVLLGLRFTTDSIAHNVSLPVFGVEIPGALLGFMVVYIGFRSYIKLYRLYKTLKNKDLKFSWQNFRGGI